MTKTADHSADVVVIGSGPAGLSAAISALDHGASVIVLDENTDIGGHAMLSGGTIHLGGGHRIQRELGIEDSPDLIFSDWTRPDMPESRYCDRELVRVFADENVATFDFLEENGVDFIPDIIRFRPDVESVGPQLVPRLFRCREWPDPAGVIVHNGNRNGSGLMRALEKSARRKGAAILLEHKMTGIARSDAGGKVDRVFARAEGRELVIAAHGGVVLATGGSTGNVDFRRIFDPRLTEEYQNAGAPYSHQTGDGEIAAMRLGAALWGMAAQTAGTSYTMARTRHIGCQWGYPGAKFGTDSPVLHRARATGLTVTDWQNLILVNQTGRRFWNEDDTSHAFFDAALSYSDRAGDPNGGGPIWAIFDAEAAVREGWVTEPPFVDPAYFASGQTLEELAANIANPYQRQPMDPQALAETIARYNSFVEAGRDADFGRPQVTHRIATPPFYAAWATPMVHDSLAGLRIDRDARVIDLHGAAIPGLFCAGETQGGFSQHGLARACVFGRIAGRGAAG